MLTESELSQLRADILELLPDSVTIQRKTITVSSSGMTTEAFATIASNVLARIDPMSNNRSDDGELAERENGRSYFTISVKYDTDIQIGDRVVFDGVTYDILQAFRNYSVRAIRRVSATVVV